MAGATAAAAQATLPSGTKLQALLVRMKANIARNNLLAQQYTSVEYWHNLNWNKQGRKVDDESAKYENVFVEGLPYRRMVEENGKPLTGRAAAKEEQRYEKAVEERKHMSLQEKRGFFHRTFHSGLPLPYLTTLFDNRAVGEVVLNARKTLVVESIPLPGAKPANPNEKTALSWKQTTWIDEQDEVPVRMEVVALQNVKAIQKGLTIRFNWVRLPPPAGDTQDRAVWLVKSITSQGWMKILLMNRRVTTDQTWSDFKKFQVDVRLLDNSVKMLPSGPGSA